MFNVLTKWSMRAIYSGITDTILGLPLLGYLGNPLVPRTWANTSHSFAVYLAFLGLWRQIGPKWGISLDPNRSIDIILRTSYDVHRPNYFLRLYKKPQTSSKFCVILMPKLPLFCQANSTFFVFPFLFCKDPMHFNRHLCRVVFVIKEGNVNYKCGGEIQTWKLLYTCLHS